MKQAGRDRALNFRPHLRQFLPRETSIGTIQLAHLSRRVASGDFDSGCFVGNAEHHRRQEQPDGGGSFARKTKTNGPFGGTANSLVSQGTSEVLARDGVESQFNPAGDAELVIDRAQVISNCMLGETEFMAYIPCT